MTEIKTINKFFHKLCQLEGSKIFSKVDFGEVMHVYEAMLREATPDQKVALGDPVKVLLDIANLQKKVKALEDQHQDPVFDPEKYICINLGGIYGKVWVPKPRK